MRVAAVCTVHELFEVPQRGLMSGIDKRPISGPLDVRTHGVWGDIQGDRENHGGLFKAVYAYSREARETLAAREGCPMPDGFFGENLVTTGWDIDDAEIGERWAVGECEFEVTCPRTPCLTFSVRVGREGFTRRFSEFGKPGVYLKVLREGYVRAGDEVTRVYRPGHGVSIADAFRGLDASQARALLEWSMRTRTVVYASLARRAMTAAQGDVVMDPALISDGRGH